MPCVGYLNIAGLNHFKCKCDSLMVNKSKLTVSFKLREEILKLAISVPVIC